MIYDEKILEKVSIDFDLTPSEHLDPEERYMRAKLLNNEINSNEIKLELMHDRYNEVDSFALEIYCNYKKIGFIQKYDNPNDIDSFCFKNNKKIADIKIEFKDYDFSIYRYLPKKESLTDEDIENYIIEGIEENGFYKTYETAYYNWEELTTYIKELIKPLEFEIRTKEEYKKFIIKNKDTYYNKIVLCTKKELQKEKEKKELELDKLEAKEKGLTLDELYRQKNLQNRKDRREARTTGLSIDEVYTKRKEKEEKDKLEAKEKGLTLHELYTQREEANKKRLDKEEAERKGITLDELYIKRKEEAEKKLKKEQLELENKMIRYEAQEKTKQFLNGTAMVIGFGSFFFGMGNHLIFFGGMFLGMFLAFIAHLI